MKSKDISIRYCRSCKSQNLSTILNLGKLYLSEFTKSNKKPQSFPLKLIFCKDCHLLQLKHNAPTSLLYSENYGYKSGINKTMQDELSDVVRKTLKIAGKKEKLTVVDIGANDGTLLSNYPKGYYRLAVDPIKKFAKYSKKHANAVVSDFFNYESVSPFLVNNKADIVTAISCFYDMEHPNKFVSDVIKILKDDGVFVIQQNYLVKMLTQNAFDNIVHEHLEYYSLTSLQNLLGQHGLEVFDLELRDLNGGSFRTYICKKDKFPITNYVREQLQLESLINLKRQKIYTDFAKRIKSIKKDVYEFIKREHENGKKIYIYGASTRGNTLLQYFDLDNKLIDKAVERNPEKWGTNIASVGIPIISEDQARKEQPDYMLVLPWFFKEEFLQREKDYLKSGGHFIFPLPALEIV